MLGLAAVDLARQVREQHVRPTEVITVALEALDRAAPLNAVVARDDTAAMAAAAQGAERLPRTAGAGRPLAGVPVTVKDWIDVVGLPCRGATANVPDRAPERATPPPSPACAAPVPSSWPRPWPVRAIRSSAAAVTPTTRPARPVVRQAAKQPCSGRAPPCSAWGATRAAASAYRRPGAAWSG